VLEHGEQQKRHQAEAQKRELVGRGAELVHGLCLASEDEFSGNKIQSSS
jgi:hypothetical protein